MLVARYTKRDTFLANCMPAYSPYIALAMAYVRVLAVSVIEALHFVSKFLSKIMSENATLPIPMPSFVVIQLVVSELWPFDRPSRVTDRQIHRQTYTRSTITPHMREG